MRPHNSKGRLCRYNPQSNLSHNTDSRASYTLNTGHILIGGIHTIYHLRLRREFFKPNNKRKSEELLQKTEVKGRMLSGPHEPYS